VKRLMITITVITLSFRFPFKRLGLIPFIKISQTRLAMRVKD
jgi:hypothetical protein